MRHFLLFLFLTIIYSETLIAQQTATEPFRFKVILSSGKSYLGEIIVQDDKSIVLLREESGIAYRIPQDQITEIRQVGFRKNYVPLYKQKGLYGSIGLGLGFNHYPTMTYMDGSIGYQFSPRAFLGAGAGLYFYISRQTEQFRAPFLEWRSIWSEHSWAPLTTVRGGVTYGSYRSDNFGYLNGRIERDYDPGFMMQILAGIRMTTFSRKDLLLETGFIIQHVNYTATEFNWNNSQIVEIRDVRQVYERWLLRCTLIL